MEALDDAELDIEPLAGLEHVVGALAAPRRWCVDDDGAAPFRRRSGADRGEIDARRDHCRLRHPTDRVVAPDDLGTGLLPVRELGGGLASDVGAEVVHHRPLAERAEDRELERLGDERQPEREVEQVGAGKQFRECPPLRGLAAELRAVELERAVRLGVHRVAVEDDERGIDAAPSQGLDVRPRHACRVDRTEDDAQRAMRLTSAEDTGRRRGFAPSTWSPGGSDTTFMDRGAFTAGGRLCRPGGQPSWRCHRREGGGSWGNHGLCAGETMFPPRAPFFSEEGAHGGTRGSPMSETWVPPRH